jgi:hypothetical protein
LKLDLDSPTMILASSGHLKKEADSAPGIGSEIICGRSQPEGLFAGGILKLKHVKGDLPGG